MYGSRRCLEVILVFIKGNLSWGGSKRRGGRKNIARVKRSLFDGWFPDSIYLKMRLQVSLS